MLYDAKTELTRNPSRSMAPVSPSTRHSEVKASQKAPHPLHREGNPTQTRRHHSSIAPFTAAAIRTINDSQERLLTDRFIHDPCQGDHHQSSPINFCFKPKSKYLFPDMTKNGSSPAILSHLISCHLIPSHRNPATLSGNESAAVTNVGRQKRSSFQQGNQGGTSAPVHAAPLLRYASPFHEVPFILLHEKMDHVMSCQDGDSTGTARGQHEAPREAGGRMMSWSSEIQLRCGGAETGKEGKQNTQTTIRRNEMR